MRPDEPVSRVMTETVVVIEADRLVSEALECFLQYPIHHLPVTRAGRLAGMLSAADLLRLKFFVPKAETDQARYLDEHFRIDELMRTPVVKCKSGATVGEVAELIIQAGVHALPVVDDDEHVIGIVSTTDIIRSLLHGPPRRGAAAPMRRAGPSHTDDHAEEPRYRRKPTDAEYATAMQVGAMLHVEGRDLKHLGKTLLYLDQRRTYLEKVLELADRFLLTGQDEHNHALLLKAIFAAKRAEEHSAGAANVPFPLE